MEPGQRWENTFDNPAPFFETLGLSFLDAGNDLIYSGAMLYKFTGDKGALLWTKRLADQYVKARNPRPGWGPTNSPNRGSSTLRRPTRPGTTIRSPNTETGRSGSSGRIFRAPRARGDHPPPATGDDDLL